jgi:ribonuclease P protein component
MLAKPQRLVKKKDFAGLFKQGRSYYTKSLGLKILASQLSLNLNRFGIVVSSKVSKKAVERNRLKRQIRQAIKEFDHELNKGLDFIIMALPGLKNYDYEAIKNELEKIFIKLKLLK